jgi:hypothetical protein
MEGEKGCDGVAIQATMLDAIVSERDKEMILEAALSKKCGENRISQTNRNCI